MPAYKEEWGDGLVPCNGLVLGALNSKSLGLASMPGTELCLFILSFPPESPKKYNMQVTKVALDEIQSMQ